MSDNDLQIRAEARVGTVLCGKYTLDGVLGVGGMAAVYAATHRNQKRVAIKLLHPELSLHREVRARFLREGYAANTVDHPGAVAVLDDDTAEDGAAFLVMERLEGEEVERIWQRYHHRLDARVVLAIADPLLSVLEAAHARSVVHRDIKPANLYVTRDGSLKVLDFGIARVRDAASGSESATRTGLMLGTPAFMSPEQALGKPNEIDGTSDVWSVGATLFALLVGRAVHDGESAMAILVQAATQPARSLAAALPGADPRLVAVVDRALAFDKAARWPNAEAMRAAVREAYLAMFGVPVGKEPLAQLIAEYVGAAATVAAPLPTPPPTPPPTPAPRPPPTADPTLDGLFHDGEPKLQAPGPPVRPSVPQGGVTIAQASSIGGEEGPPLRGGRGKRSALWPMAFAGVVIVSAGGAWIVASRVWPPRAGAPASTASAPETLKSPAPPPPSLPPPSPAPSTATTPVVSASQEAPPPASAAVVASVPHLKPPSPPPWPASPALPSPSPRGVAARPNCDPPFTIDRAGHRDPKPECL